MQAGTCLLPHVNCNTSVLLRPIGAHLSKHPPCLLFVKLVTFFVYANGPEYDV